MFNTIILFSKPQLAEILKLYKNYQRIVAIVYANKIADAYKELRINPFKVAQTSTTKLFRYLPIDPLLGIREHYILVNLVYSISTYRLLLLQ